MSNLGKYQQFQMLQQNTYGMQINETNRSKFEMAQIQIKVFEKKFSKQS